MKENARVKWKSGGKNGNATVYFVGKDELADKSYEQLYINYFILKKVILSQKKIF